LLTHTDLAAAKLVARRIHKALKAEFDKPPYVVAVDSFTVQAPEPGMLSLFGALALVGLARRRRMSQAA